MPLNGHHLSRDQFFLLMLSLSPLFSLRLAELTAVIQNPVHWKLATLPRALTPDEIERLLESFSTRYRWPKRSYAIIRCALDLGLRSGEIAGLKISDIDWRAGTVTLKGTKTLRQDILPLPMETGQALADYWR